jgi:hypothetical protein
MSRTLKLKPFKDNLKGIIHFSPFMYLTKYNLYTNATFVTKQHLNKVAIVPELLHIVAIKICT